MTPSPPMHATWLQRLQGLLGLDDAILHVSVEDEAAYRERQQKVFNRLWMALFVGILLMALAWWPTDFVIFHGQAKVIRAFAIARSVSALLTITGLALVVRMKVLGRHVLTVTTSLACLNLGLWAYEFGELGPPGALWFNFLPQLLFAGIFLVAAPRDRVLVVSSLAGAIIIGYFGLHPHYFLDPYAPAVLSCLVCTILASTGAGMTMEYLRRQAFFHRLAAERQAQAVAEMNGQLESRVAEQTAELRALTLQQENVRENERTHIARELHDELGQELTALRLALKFAQLRYERQDGDIRGNMEELQALLARTTATTRSILTELRPRVLDDLGLVAAVEWLVERAHQRNGIACQLERPATDPSLTDEVAIAAFRIVQEALTNITRHARARQAQVTIRSAGDMLELVVQDDGQGFVWGQGTAGLGVVGMRERARAVGGEMAIETAPGTGARVQVRLPLKRQPQETA